MRFFKARGLLSTIFVFFLATLAVWASDVGLFVRATNSGLTPVTGKTWILNSTDRRIYVWNGTAYEEANPPALISGGHDNHYFLQSDGVHDVWNPILNDDLPILSLAVGGLNYGLNTGNAGKMLVGVGNHFEEIAAPTAANQRLATKQTWTTGAGASEYTWAEQDGGKVNTGVYRQVPYYNADAANNVLDGNTDFTANLGNIALGHHSPNRDATILMYNSAGGSTNIQIGGQSGNTSWVFPPTNGSNKDICQNQGSGYAAWVSMPAALADYNARSSSFTAAAGKVYGVDSSSGAVVCTLPTASGISGQTILVSLRTAGNALTINTTGGETIDGALSGSLSTSTQYDRYMFMSDGTNWIRML